MPFDGIAAHAAAREFRESLTGCKISRVYQPAREEIVIYFAGRKDPLLLSASAESPRAQFTGLSFDNPEYPPSFCMLLRKYLIGGIVRDVRQYNFDRVILFDIEALSSSGIMVPLMLSVEIMGRYSNIILVDKRDMRMIDAVKHVSGLKSSVRKVMPNFDYSYPPNEKLDPGDYDISQALGMLSLSGEKEVKTALSDTFSGVSRQFAESFLRIHPEYGKKISAITGEELRNLPGIFAAEMKKACDSAQNCIYIEPDGKYRDFSHSSYAVYEGYRIKSFSRISEMLDEYYRSKAQNDTVRERYSSLIRSLSTLYDKEKRKLDVREKERAEAEDSGRYNMYGNLILSNLYKIKKGMESITVANFYDEAGGDIEIPLSVRLNPTENANAYFRKYDRAKKALAHLDELIAKSRRDTEFLGEQLYFLTKAENYAEAAEVERALFKEGWIKPPKNSKTVKPAKVKAVRFVSPDGFTILAGKNSRQNEELTFKTAVAGDIWLHVKDYPAAHVILKTNNGSYSEEALYAAAQAAVYCSAAADSRKVAVDYTPVENVRKIPQSTPGHVTYTKQKTLYIDPDMNLIGAIKEENDG
ncbi:MAG: NFACT family protein [Eubacteriaceae bacterium]|nr:NFACT family protein [Eubacteriaceae bacterium]